MSDLLDSKGRPVRPKLSDEDIVNAFNQLIQRIQFQHNQITFTGLTLEYLFKIMEEKLNVKIDNVEVQKYMQSRIEEIQKEANNLVAEDVENFADAGIVLEDE